MQFQITKWVENEIERKLLIYWSWHVNLARMRMLKSVLENKVLLAVTIVIILKSY